MTMTTAALLSRAQNGSVAEHDKPTRRRFTAAYKLAILQSCSKKLTGAWDRVADHRGGTPHRG